MAGAANDPDKIPHRDTPHPLSELTPPTIQRPAALEMHVPPVDATPPPSHQAAKSQRIPTQDLMGDPLLKLAHRETFQGQECPTLNGIPLLAKLGEGGMGAVYYGIHPRLFNEVAIKVLPFETIQSDPDAIRRFTREARLAAQVHSPHLVQVTDVNYEVGLHFLVMEFVAGETAFDALIRYREQNRGGGLPEHSVIDLAVACAAGLAEAHLHGIVHRDIKPENIMIPFVPGREPDVEFRKAKLMDLGLARMERNTASDISVVTQQRVSMGTPGFMSPEQIIDSRSADKRSDVFSMGAAMYALLAARGPFHREHQMKVLMATVEEPHPPLSQYRPDVSPLLTNIIDRCLEKRPEARYQDGRELHAICRQVQKLIGSATSNPLMPATAYPEPPQLPVMPMNSTPGTAVLRASEMDPTRAPTQPPMPFDSSSLESTLRAGGSSRVSESARTVVRPAGYQSGTSPIPRAPTAPPIEPVFLSIDPRAPQSSSPHMSSPGGLVAPRTGLALDQLVSVPARTQRNWAVWIATGVAAVVIGVAVFVTSKAAPAPQVAVESPEAQQQAYEQFVAAAQDMIAQGKIDGARVFLRKAREFAPDVRSEDFEKQIDTIIADTLAKKKVFEETEMEFKEALLEEELPAAQRLFSVLVRNSVGESGTKLLDEHRRAVDRLREQKESLPRLSKLVEEWNKTPFADAKQAAEELEKLGEEVAKVEDSRDGRQLRSAWAEALKRKKNERDYQRLLADAAAAGGKRNYHEAVELAEEARLLFPHLPQAPVALASYTALDTVQKQEAPAAKQRATAIDDAVKAAQDLESAGDFEKAVDRARAAWSMARGDRKVAARYRELREKLQQQEAKNLADARKKRLSELIRNLDKMLLADGEPHDLKGATKFLDEAYALDASDAQLTELEKLDKRFKTLQGYEALLLKTRNAVREKRFDDADKLIKEANTLVPNGARAKALEDEIQRRGSAPKGADKR